MERGDHEPHDASVELRLATERDRPQLQLWMRAHLHWLAAWNPTVDVDAPFDERWFQMPGVLFPWIVRLEDQAAGFALMGGGRLAAAMGALEDFYLHEFHILREFRGRGVGRRAVALLSERHLGRWAMDVLAANRSALGFWDRVLAPRGVRRRAYTDETGVEFLRISTER